MEELVSKPSLDSNSHSHGFIDAEVISHNESNTHCTWSRPVPHHSLSVSLSDPEAPLSFQVDDVIVSDAKHDFESAQLLLKPDSMPNETSMKVCGETGSQTDPDSYSGFNSHNEKQKRVYDKNAEVVRKSSFLSSIMQVADKHTCTSRSSRPKSAPSRSVVVSGGSTTLPSHLNRSEVKLLTQKQHSNEKLGQKENIEEGARAALQYSAECQNLHVKALSLPRDHKSASLSAASLTSSELYYANRQSSTISSPKCCPNTTFPSGDSRETEASITVGKESYVFQNSEQVDKTEEDETTNNCDCGVSGESVHAGFTSSANYSGDGDGRKYNIVEEKDICISFQAPQSQSIEVPDLSAAQSKSSGDTEVTFMLPHIVNEETGRHRAASFSNKQIDSLLQTLRSLSVHDEVEDLNILEGMLKSNTFKKAKHVHDSMHSLLSCGPNAPNPVVKRAVPMAQHIRQQLRQHSEPLCEVSELRTLLRAPHVQAVLLCHDKVSTRDLYIPDTYFHRTAQDPVDIILSDSVYNFQAPDHCTDTTTLLSRDVPSCRKEDATIVFLERTNRPFGCTIYKQEESVFIGKLSKGCDAEISDLLREGDELLEIDGVPVIGKSTDEIVTLMSGDVQCSTMLALTIIPVHDDNIDLEYEPKYVKAHFNYNSKHDEDIPCKALGLTFQKGDILEVSNQDNPEWWQARKVFDDGAESLPGLIPSRHLQQQREALIKSYPFTSEIKKKGIRSFFSNRRKKKIFYQGMSPNQTFGVGDELPTYEDVIRFEPNSDVIRPIVLIGAPGVGRRTLIRKLLNSNTSCYIPVIQYTTRPIRPGEINGQDYHFVTREEFECDIEQDRFLEYGELKGCYYGTAFSSIKKIMESHHVPVLELHPQALKKVRHCGLKPYIVFVAPPRLERLHATRRSSPDKVKKRLGSTLQYQESTSQKLNSESDLQHLVHESYIIENQYGHYFDWIIINDDFQVAADMLKEVAHRVQEEPQWVPKVWYLDNY